MPDEARRIAVHVAYLCQIVTLVAPNEAFCNGGPMMRVEFWGGVYGWVIIDTDKVPSNGNYYGLCACGFEREQDAWSTE